MKCVIIALSPTRSVWYRHATTCTDIPYNYVHVYSPCIPHVRVSMRTWAIVHAIITHSIVHQLKPHPLHQQNQSGLSDFSRETLKNMGRLGSRLTGD